MLVDVDVELGEVADVERVRLLDVDGHEVGQMGKRSLELWPPPKKGTIAEIIFFKK